MTVLSPFGDLVVSDRAQLLVYEVPSDEISYGWWDVDSECLTPGEFAVGTLALEEWVERPYWMGPLADALVGVQVTSDRNNLTATPYPVDRFFLCEAGQSPPCDIAVPDWVFPMMTDGEGEIKLTMTSFVPGTANVAVDILTWSGFVRIGEAPVVFIPPYTTSSAPQPERLALPSEPINQKMRYLSFQVSEDDAGRQQAVRVHMIDLPPPYDAWNGTKMYVGPPTTYCENPGVVTPPCPFAQPRVEWTGADLQCSPEIRDWNADEVVHVFHEGIVPGGRYHVQAVDASSLDVECSYSDPLVVSMSSWGDLIRNCATCPCSPPDGSVGIPTDVTAVLDKFKNSGYLCYPPVKVRAEHDWCTPNHRIDISDVTFCLDAFRGVQYPPPSFTDSTTGCVSTEPPCGGVACGQ